MSEYPFSAKNTPPNCVDPDFYQAFQEHFRGSFDAIKERLTIYVSYISELAKNYPEIPAVDLGSGRGEWLELLNEHGIGVYGIEKDNNLREVAERRGLTVVHGDALEHIKQLPEQSRSVITAFHVVEHMTFEEMYCLVKEAHRVLVPGGMLLMETPNPENIVVGSSKFYLDPTHTKPIPPEMLAFIPKYLGFFRVKIMRLNETVSLNKTKHLSILDVLGGVSPDYCVLAQKEADTDLLQKTSFLFQETYGVRLEEIAEFYHRQFSKKLNLRNTRLLLYKFINKLCRLFKNLLSLSKKVIFQCKDICR
ncbi:TPA: class I SAM-dependent methyltransferase [Legionella pneumophila]|uniref:Class I SAM-dependent methyltransferase n=4 Tax=Legionella pneumophila TaxID=446 RepID=A0AAN5PF12_LEGPN|nr:class I SAM-dependent methyltransferase [Legionella pneumophila]ERH42883.1 methyltransferase [Legionella pneumophila str. Leg01/53]ERH43905.1 methyltransferase [Legionella pneumophila str. Leg01/11]ERI47018.1 methyltransferase [Legionella pneumophila str. Leg01/20]ANN96976.1 methyltransferase [Legionella pneumophila]ERB41379.1 methyltransferase [Legionella pneumophila str. 121004]